MCTFAILSMEYREKLEIRFFIRLTIWRVFNLAESNNKSHKQCALYIIFIDSFYFLVLLLTFAYGVRSMCNKTSWREDEINNDYGQIKINVMEMRFFDVFSFHFSCALVYCSRMFYSSHCISIKLHRLLQIK